MKRLFKVLKDNRGEMYVDLCVMVLVFVMLLVVVIQAIPALVLKYELNTFTTAAVRRIELTGMVDSETMNVINDLAEMRNLDPVIEIDAYYIDSTNKVQIDNKITITATHEYDLGFGPLGSFPIIFRSRAEGYSEVYFRE